MKEDLPRALPAEERPRMIRLPDEVPAEERETPVKPLVERIAAWRQDDGQGYDVATDLLHEAEGLLRRLFETGGYCVRCGEPWTAHHWQPNTYVCRDKARALPAEDRAVTPPCGDGCLGCAYCLRPSTGDADRAVTAPQEQEDDRTLAGSLRYVRGLIRKAASSGASFVDINVSTLAYLVENRRKLSDQLRWAQERAEKVAALRGEMETLYNTRFIARANPGEHEGVTLECIAACAVKKWAAILTAWER